MAAWVAVLASMTFGSSRGRMLKATPWDALVDLLVVRPRVDVSEAALSQGAEALPQTDEVEARLAQAEQRWRSSFRRRASVMKGALRLATNEDLPTPQTDGDD